LAVLVLLIVLSNFFQAKTKVEEQKNPSKSVSLFSIGSVPRLTVLAQIEKTGVIDVVSLTGGVVQKVNFHEGDYVKRGQTLVSLSSNYQGGVAQSVQRQLAGNQYNGVVETYDQQKEAIARQRDVAEKSEDNAEKLRGISDDSRETTRSLIDLDKELLEDIDDALDALPENDTNADKIAELRSQKVQLLSGLAQAQASLAQADYQSSDEEPPADLARLQKDLTLKQLDIQEKMLEVNKEAARLQLKLAEISEALMYPSSPVNGQVQRVFVHEGDVVSPGTKIAVVLQGIEEDPITAIAYVPAESVDKISKTESSYVKIGKQKYEIDAYFISSEAVSGNLYAVYYSIPDKLGNEVTDGGYIEIEIPIDSDTPKTKSEKGLIYIPVDAVYQSENEAYVFVSENDRAKSRSVDLGDVYGGYVAVEKGLKMGDLVVLTRNVVDGDEIRIQN